MDSNAANTAAQHLSAAQAGDRLAFASLVRSHQRMVHGLALRMLGRFDQADDLAQDVFLKLHQHMTEIESAEHLAFWLRRVTANLSIDRLRQRTPHVQPLENAELEFAAPANGEDHLLRRRLLALLAELPSQARAVMLLRYQQDQDPSDIADTLGMPLNTVKSHLKRSIDSLRRRLTTDAAMSTQGPQP